jgi:hypothetical protein
MNMEVSNEKALLVVRIANSGRLNADVTEDFFLVNPDKFKLISEVLRDIQNKRPGEINTILELKRTFDNYNVEYQHVIDGQRFVFGVDSVEIPEEDA